MNKTSQAILGIFVGIILLAGTFSGGFIVGHLMPANGGLPSLSDLDLIPGHIVHRLINELLMDNIPRFPEWDKKCLQIVWRTGLLFGCWILRTRDEIETTNGGQSAACGHEVPDDDST